MIKFDKIRSSFYSTKLHFRHGYTNIKAGENQDRATQHQYFQALFPAKNLLTFTGHQQHGTEIKILNPKKDEGIVGDYDGLLLPNAHKHPPVVVYVKTADCLSLIVESQKAQLIGAIHVGWQGAYKGMLQSLAMKLTNLGVNLSEVRVMLGSSINGCCYNIPRMRYRMFQDKYGQDVAGFSEHENQLFFSLPTFVLSQLLNLGFKKANLDYQVNCTVCQPHFFSYRRQNHTLNRLLTYVTNYV